MKLHVKVIPSSSKDTIAGWLEHCLKIKVQAPAEKGKANKAVIRLLEKTLELPRGSIEISGGSTSTRKMLEIKSEDDNLVNKKLRDIYKP